MIVLISPAKTLDFEPTAISEFSIPRMLTESESLVKDLKKKSVRSIKKLMGVSDKIATLNVERYQSFSTPFTPDNAKQAALAFKGDVYQGLQAEELDDADLDFAQKYLRILSGLYGLLKPLDLMQPYRLEMGTPLKKGRKKNLYEFWGSKITNLINTDLEASDSDAVLNLASQEYFRSVKPQLLTGRLIHVSFKEERNGVFKVISFNAKKARGVMARQIIKKRILEPEMVLGLDVDGYQYNGDLSEPDHLVFTK